MKKASGSRSSESEGVKGKSLLFPSQRKSGGLGGASHLRVLILFNERARGACINHPRRGLGSPLAVQAHVRSETRILFVNWTGGGITQIGAREVFEYEYVVLVSAFVDRNAAAKGSLHIFIDVILNLSLQSK